MQRIDESKRRAIIGAAAELFATNSFEVVRLDTIAERAHVGKGTLYVYFKSKEELYGQLVYEGFSQLVERLEEQAGKSSTYAWDTLSSMVTELVSWAFHSPHFFKLMRDSERQCRAPGLIEKRQELGKLLEQTIQRGIDNGEFSDPRPDLTAQFIPACVRGALRHGPADVREDEVVQQILRIIGRGILAVKLCDLTDTDGKP